MLGLYNEGEKVDKVLVLEIARDSLLLAEQFFGKQFYKTPIITMSNLKKAIDFYGIEVLNDD